MHGKTKREGKTGTCQGPYPSGEVKPAGHLPQEERKQEYGWPRKKKRYLKGSDKRSGSDIPIAPVLVVSPKMKKKLPLTKAAA
jgi:hypothetical protein